MQCLPKRTEVPSVRPGRAVATWALPVTSAILAIGTECAISGGHSVDNRGMNIPPSKPSPNQSIAPHASIRSRQAAPNRSEPNAPARVAAQESQDPRGRLESFNQHVQDRLQNFIEVQDLSPEQASIVKEAAAEFSSLVERLSGAFDQGTQGAEHLADGFRGMMQNLRSDVRASRSSDAQVEKAPMDKAADMQRMEPAKPMDTQRMEPGKALPERMGMDALATSNTDRLANIQSMMGDRIQNGLAQSGLSDSQMNMLESAQQSFDSLLARMSNAIEQRGGMQQQTMSKGLTFIMNSLRNDVQTMLQAVPKGLNKMA